MPDRPMRAFIFLATSMLIGCASIRDRKQVLLLSCDYEPCQVENRNENLIYDAPAFVEVDRTHELKIRYIYGKTIHDQLLKGKPRWLESVTANMVLGYFNPQIGAIGFFIDYLTGSMWDLPNPRPPDILNPKEAPAIDHIYIAPVRALSQLQSDEAVEKTFQKLTKEFPSAGIEAPEKNIQYFEKQGWTYKSTPVSLYGQSELFYKLNIRYLATVDLKEKSDDEKQIIIDIKDVTSRRHLGQFDVHYQSSHRGLPFLIWTRSKLIDFSPNSIGIESVKSNQFGVDMRTVGDKIYSYEANKDQGNYEGRIFISNLDQDLGQRFRFVFRVASSFSVRKSTSVIKRKTYTSDPATNEFVVSDSASSTIDQYGVAGNIGPEVGLVGALGYVYCHFLIGPELLYSRSRDSGQALARIYLPPVIDLGYRIFLTENFQFNAYFSAKGIPSWVSKEVFNLAFDEAGKNPFWYDNQIGIGLIFSFPEMNRFARQKARGLLTSF